MALREAIKRAKKDPNSPFADELRSRIESGAMDRFAQAEGITLPSRTPIPEEPVTPFAAPTLPVAGEIPEVAPESLAGRVRGAVRTGLEVGAEQFEKARAGVETIAGAFAPETFVQRPEGDVTVPTEESREIINRIEQFGKGLQEFGAGTIGTVFGPLIGALIGAARPEIQPIIQKISESQTGQQIADAIGELPSDVQDSALNLLETVGIKGAAQLRKGVAVAAREVTPVAARAARGLEEAAEVQTQVARKGFAQELVQPKQTKKVITEQIKGGQIEEGGLFSGRSIIPTASERAIIEEVSRIPNVTPQNTLLQNANIVRGEIGNTAKELVSKLEANDVIFPRRELNSFLNAAKETLKLNPALVGDAAKSADKILDQFERILKTKKSSASGLLEARKELDRFIQTQKGAKAFDPATENAFSIALREIRQGANEFLDAKAIDVDVKGLLKKQSNLFRAIDNIAPKAAEEASTAIGRGLQRATEIVGLRGQIGQVITALGITGGATALAALTPAALLAAIPVGLIVGGVKTAKSVAAKKALSTLLRQLKEQSLRLSGADKEVVDALIAQIAPILIEETEEE